METQIKRPVSGNLPDEIIEKQRGKPGMLLTTLEEAQEKNHFK